MLLRLAQNIINSLSVLIFFFFYKANGIIVAASALFVLHVFLFGFNFYILKRFFITNLISTIIVCLFSLITVLTREPQYVMFHVTVLNFYFAILLFIGIVLKKNFLRLIIGDLLPSKGNVWLLLSRYWAILFIFIAILNEIIRYFGSEVLWVYFDVFGINIITFLFLLFQMNHIKKVVNLE